MDFQLTSQLESELEYIRSLAWDLTGYCDENAEGAADAFIESGYNDVEIMVFFDDRSAFGDIAPDMYSACNCRPAYVIRVPEKGAWASGEYTFHVAVVIGGTTVFDPQLAENVEGCFAEKEAYIERFIAENDDTQLEIVSGAYPFS